MDIQYWLQNISDFLVSAGVPAEHGSMAALALVYLALTLLSLLVVILLLRRNLHSRRADAAAPVEQEPAVEESQRAEVETEPEETTVEGALEEEAPSAEEAVSAVAVAEEPVRVAP